MGTRADFYVGRGESAEWLGSIAYDGYPDGVFGDVGTGQGFIGPDAERDWRAWIDRLLAERKSATRPEDGWPWPWEDSCTTDYAYALDDGTIYGSCFGHAWFAVDPTSDGYGQPEEDTPESAVFPNMKDQKNVTLGPRSGLLILGM